MKYSDGTEVKVGDRVRLSNGDTATVVFDVDADLYESEFPKDDWGYLESGIMVETDGGALIHLDEKMLNSLSIPENTR